MSDEELVKSLRNFDDGATPTHEAADRIEALLNLNEALVELMDDRDAKLAKAVEALNYCINAPFSGWTIAQGYARTVLAEIESSEAVTLEGERND